MLYRYTDVLNPCLSGACATEAAEESAAVQRCRNVIPKINTAVALGGVVLRGTEPAEALRFALGRAFSARGDGVPGVQLDGTFAGLRARELDRSARRDIAATFKRTGTLFSGIDLFIPTHHWSDPQHQDRALEAGIEALAMVGELARLTECPDAHLCVDLPPGLPPLVVSELVTAAMRAGVRIADCAGTGSVNHDAVLGTCIDPARVLMDEYSITRFLLGFANGMVAARLTDSDRKMRLPVGQGRLKVADYKSLLGAMTQVRTVVIDPIGLPDPIAAVKAAATLWHEAQGGGPAGPGTPGGVSLG